MQLDQLRSKETFEAWTQKGMGPVSAPWLVKNPQFDDLTQFLFGDFSAMFEYTEGWFEGKCNNIFDSRTFPDCMPVLDASKPIQ
jgi:hypothetical protein